MRPFKLKLLLIKVCILFTIGSSAQTEIAIAPVNLNILYIGIDNPVNVAAYGAKDHELAVSVSGSGASIRKVKPGQYVIRVSQVSDSCIVTVHAAGKLKGKSIFRVRNIPSPSATIAGYYSGSKISAEVFKKEQGLSTYIKDFPITISYEVVSFGFAIDTGEGEITTLHNQGAIFQEKLRKLIDQYVEKGRLVTIDRILVKDAEGKVHKIPSLAYYIQ